MQTMNKTYGEYLGYPPCCIEAFGEVAIFFTLRPMLSQAKSVNGFIPCEECARKLARNETTYNELIDPNRKCSVPFKEEHNHTEELTISAELNQLTID